MQSLMMNELILFNKHQKMQFKNIIKQQKFKDKRRQTLPDLLNSNNLPYLLSNKETKNEIVIEKKNIDNEGSTGLRNTKRCLEERDEKIRELVSRVELKEQPQLSSDERKLVGDISRLFAHEPSRPTKILVRMNQTQTNRSNQPNSPKENRLDKIEITRLQNDKYDKLPNQSRTKQSIKQNINCLEYLRTSQVGSEKQSYCQNQSLINIRHSSENVSPSFIKQFSISKQLSLMFIPDYNYSASIGMKNPPQIFTKFREKFFKDGLNSATSNCSSDSLMVKDEPQFDNILTTKFTKLMQIEFFQKRKEVQHARAEQLRHANQKLLASHLVLKDQLENNAELIKKMQKQFKLKVAELQKDAQFEREKVKQLTIDLENKQKTNKSLIKLSEQYLKQNNDLKQKIKQYIRNIHDLKAEITIKEKIGIENNGQMPKPVVVEKNKEVKKLKAFYPPLPSFSDLPKTNYQKAQPILKKQLTFSQINQGNYIANQFYEANPNYNYHQDAVLPHNFTRPSEKIQGKLMNSKSQEIIRLPGKIQEVRGTNYDIASRSQRNVGIKKNQQTHQPVTPSTKNLVRVNKNIHNDASIIVAQKMRDNKSLSSISNLSGKSLSQRIGYVLKPTPKDPKNGILVDYMIEQQPMKPQQKQQKRDQSKRQHLKFNKNE